MDVLRVAFILLAIFSSSSADDGSTFDFTELGANNVDTFDVTDYGAKDVTTFDATEYVAKNEKVNVIGSGAGDGNTFDVMKYGAQGDGQTNDEQAFLVAWKDVCDNGGTLLVPKGQFVLYPTQFAGPCKASNVHVQILGHISSPTAKGAWKKCEDWIQFSDIENLFVDGSGEFNGQGETWWTNHLSCGNRPTSLAFKNCHNLRVSGIHSLDSARNHISISKCEGVRISNITLQAPGDSPNTDGIDISHSSDVLVESSNIGTGDDCIAINTQTKNIDIRNIACGPGHGISVGSLGRDGEEAQVEGVRVTGCKFNGTTNGARIKTWLGGKGYAKSILFEQITLTDVKNPIIITQHYVDKHHKPKSNEELSYAIEDSDDDADDSYVEDPESNVDPLSNKKKKKGSRSVDDDSSKDSDSNKSVVAISDVKFIDFKGTSKDKNAITVDCVSKSSCTDIVMNNIHIRAISRTAVATCQNAAVQAISTEPKVSCS